MFLHSHTSSKDYYIIKDIVQRVFKGKLHPNGITPMINHPIELSSLFYDQNKITVALGHNLLKHGSDLGIDEARLRKEGVSEYTINGIVTLTQQPNERYEAYIDRICNSDWVSVKIGDIFLLIRDNPTYVNLIKYNHAMSKLLNNVTTKCIM